MNSTTARTTPLRAAAAAAALPPLLLLSLIVIAPSVARARVIEVGPTRAVRTIDAALARAAVGDEIVLDRGVEFLTSGLKIERDAIEIRSADGSGAPATIRNVSTAKWPNTIEHHAEGLLLKDLVFTGGANVTCVRARGRRLTVDNAVPTSSVWRWVQMAGASQTTIRNCDVPQLPSYAICAFDHDSRILLIDRCTFAGGATESHTIRLQRTYGARIRDCTINANGARSALNIRDGGDNRVEGCTINGPLAIGPLADADGGINLPTTTSAERARREQLLRRTQTNLTYKNCTIETNGITVEMGTQDLIFDGCRIKTNRLWAIRLNKDEYEPWRCVPTGKVVNCELIGPAGLKVFERERPDFHVFSTTVNGLRIPDFAPPPSTTTKPGGAVPGEVNPPPATTSPATQPAVLRFDLIDTASGAVIRELKGGDDLPATMPAASAPAVNVLVTTDPPVVGSVRVSHNGVARLERTAPYTVGAPSLFIPAGENVIEATPFASTDGSGAPGRSAKITFNRKASETPSSSSPPPTTAPAPHQDVIAAIGHLEAALRRLHSATQPTQ